ncbi:MFS transporter [Streptomyces sp. URMC 126]|uniref:MFS transporter n=1 Tax=Streptomyces sp. URMC 126 TaxID=3423401 RepID=UPI003F1A32DF
MAPSTPPPSGTAHPSTSPATRITLSPTGTNTPIPTPLHPKATLPLLTACVFLIGTGEWVMVGLLPTLAADLNRPLPAVGRLVTWYALVVTVAGPVVTVAVLRLSRRRALLGLLGVFVVGNAGAALADGAGMLAAARVVTALTHSTSFATALVIAVSAAPAAQRGRAIAVVAAGWNLATVLGAPLGTWIGGRYGWRTTFGGIAALSVLVLIAVALVVRPPEPRTRPAPRAEVRSLLGRDAIRVLAVTVLAQAGLFTLHTYIAPLLDDVSGFSPDAVTLLLAVFGGGALLGNVLDGRFADRAPQRALPATLLTLAAVLAALAVASHARWSAALTVLVLGVVSAVLIPLLQERALAAAPGAPTLITAVTASAFNLGTAGGSALGGQALGSGLALDDLAWLGGLLVTAAAVLAAVRPGRVPSRAPAAP